MHGHHHQQINYRYYHSRFPHSSPYSLTTIIHSISRIDLYCSHIEQISSITFLLIGGEMLWHTTFIHSSNIYPHGLNAWTFTRCVNLLSGFDLTVFVQIIRDHCLIIGLPRFVSTLVCPTVPLCSLCARRLRRLCFPSFLLFAIQFAHCHCFVVIDPTCL